MRSKQNVIAAIIDQGILPLFYCDSVTISADVTRILYKAGIRVVEYTNRGGEALKVFKALKKIQEAEMPDLYIGIGTIKSLQDAESFIAAGADFLVAPIINPDVAGFAKQNNLVWIPGCMTPTEVFVAQNCGAQLIKLFPAGLLGPGFLTAIRELFPDLLFMATGGVDLEKQSMVPWLQAGACAIGIGNKLISKNILEEKDYNKLYHNVLLALSVIRSLKKEIL